MSITEQSNKSKHFDLTWTPLGSSKYLNDLQGKVILRFEMQQSSPIGPRIILRPNGKFTFGPIESKGTANVSVDPYSIHSGNIGQPGTINGVSISCKTIAIRDIGCIRMQERTQRDQELNGLVLKIEYVSSYGRDPAFSA